MVISADCLEELRAVRRAADRAADGAHDVSQQLKRLADFADHLNQRAKKWLPRILYVAAGALVTSGAAGPAAKAVLSALGHPG